MASISPTHSSIWSSRAQKHCFAGRFSEGRRQGYTGSLLPFKSNIIPSFDHVYNNQSYKPGKLQTICSSSLNNIDPVEPEDENSDNESSKPEGQPVYSFSCMMAKRTTSDGFGQKAGSDSLRDNLERIIGVDDSKFNGADLAALIRKKYGRSYDVQLIKKEFMGRNLLAMNVMWKYREQRSFPLTEEEYILRLDDVANNLRCWGAVSHIRNSLAKLKERPRIGKAVSIFIDMDDSGARSNEWIYK